MFAQDAPGAAGAAAQSRRMDPERCLPKLPGLSGPQLAQRPAAAGPQCDISTGTVIDCSMVRVAPPNIHSFRREWP
jgi:hypothetical protein